MVPFSRPLSRGARAATLLALLSLAGSRPADAQCINGELTLCGNECDAWQTVSGSIAPGGAFGYLFHAGYQCEVKFSFCQPGGSAGFATTLAIWDSTCTIQLAAAGSTCDSLSELTWYGDYTGAFVVVVGGQDLSAGSYTLAYHCTCDPQATIGQVQNPYQNFPTQFTGLGSFSYLGDIVSYEWDFGDGGSGSGPTPTHAYSQQGTYGVQLEVTDVCGNTALGYGEATILDCDANPNIPALRAGEPRLLESAARPPRRFGVDERLTNAPGSEVIGAQSMAADTAGDVHLVYGVDRFAPYFGAAEASIYHRVWNGATETWGAEGLAAFVPQGIQVRSVAMAADSLNNLHVVWSQRDAKDVTEIRTVRRAPNLTWGTPQLLKSTADFMASDPAIAADGHGNVFVAWAEADLTHGTVYHTVRSADTGDWYPSPQPLTNLAEGGVTDVCIAVDESLAPGVRIAHFGWTQFGGPGDAVAHRMLAIKEPSGQLQLSSTTDLIPSFQPCDLSIGSSGAGLHVLFGNCFNGKIERLGASGGPHHFVGVTTPGPPNGWPTFALGEEELPADLKGGFASDLTADRFGNLHAIMSHGSLLTTHAEWSVKDSLWSNGDQVRDVASGFILTTALAVDRELRVHTAWLDRRAPDSPCSGELYGDIGICTPPQLPESLKVVGAGTGHQLVLDWQLGPDSTATACRYVVYRALARDAVYDSVADVAGPPWVDRDDLIRGMSYVYRIRPYNLCGEQGDTTAAAVGIPRFPLVFVHGCCGGGLGTWTDFNQYFASFGPEAYAPQDLWTVAYDSWGTLTSGADSLEYFMDHSIVPYYRDTYGTAADTIDIVSHSMGGIVSRVYIHAFRRPVGSLVTLGSPHAGTSLAVLLASQIKGLIAHAPHTLPLFDMSYVSMLMVNALLNDTPLTLNPWTQCAPPAYHLAAGIALDDVLCEGTNDGVVNVFSAMFPIGCDQALFFRLHDMLNKDLSAVAPWVRDRLLEDSLHVDQSPAFRIPPAVLADSASIADSLALHPFAHIEGHDLEPGQAAVDTVDLDGVTQASFGVFHFSGTATLTLRSPSGQVVDPAYAASDPAVDLIELAGEEGSWQTYVVTNPEPGAWTMTTTAITLAVPSEAFVTFCAVVSPVRAELAVPLHVVSAGASVPLLVHVTSGAEGITGCAVTAKLVAPDASTSTVLLFDDGAHDDGAAGDGAYGSAPLSLPTDGNYAVQALAEGTASGGAFARRDNNVIFVGDRLPPGIRLLSPVGGESYAPGSGQVVRWDSSDDTGIDSVIVELSLDDGGTYQRLGATAGADSAFAWTTPDTATHRARIRVTASDLASHTGSDASDASFTIGAVMGVPGGLLGSRPSLGWAFPNPFRASTTLDFSLPAQGFVRMTVYDVAGRKVKTLVNEVRAPGRHRVTWNGESDAGQRLGSGVYFVQFNVGAVRVGRKLMILK